MLTDGSIKLLDLGLAYTPGLPGHVDVGIPGTPAYMAPELVAGSPGDARSEVFALGVTLFRMLSGGRMPYSVRPGIPLTLFRRDAPYEMIRVLEKSLSSHPEDRHQDALEFAFDIEQIPALSPLGRHPRIPLLKRNPLIFWQELSALLFILLMVFLALHV